MSWRLMKVAEAAERLTLSVKQVYQLLHDKEIPHVRMGGSIRVLERDVEGYLDAHYNGDPQSASVRPEGADLTTRQKAERRASKAA